ncbi:HAUS augmin-like complex subunit 7 [Lampris incognitus]|uniref:HAUS augmin-like complex subunit 7 n=1 Tax=Lampris incognitus TaxID=2546036 RepID=UPI0024B62659|nr:HAUS augmin-like complex subunit 7 [Lampris incognitus]
MAGDPKAERLARQVYATLQAACCPAVEGLYLREAASMQELLCTPSQSRMDILAWICSSINPNINLKMTSKDQDVVTKAIVMLGQELMLCKADDLDLIGGRAGPHRQLQFLEQLLTVVPCSGPSAEGAMDEDRLLSELCSDENRPHLTHMLSPSLDPWPTDFRTLPKCEKSFHKSSREEAADVAALLQSTQTALEQLYSDCEFLRDEAQRPAIFSPCALRVAVCDLCQLVAAFKHVYEADLRGYCNRGALSLSAEAHTFQRVHELLLACKTELELLNEVSEASEAVTYRAGQLQTQPRYWSHGEKYTLPYQLEKISRRYRNFLSLLHCDLPAALTLGSGDVQTHNQ